MVDLPNHAVDARTVPMLALATGYSEVHGRPPAANAGQYAAASGPFPFLALFPTLPFRSPSNKFKPAQRTKWVSFRAWKLNCRLFVQSWPFCGLSESGGPWPGFWLLGGDARQLRKQSGIIDNTPLIEQLAIQARLYDLRGSPALLETGGNGSPMLIGILRPAIVVPGGTVRKLSLPELAMVLGHELAHIRRGDLLWSLAAACVRTVFFFHPLVWLSQRQLNLAQEVAADELAILRQHHDPASYGTLLVSVISRLGPSRLIPTMSMGTAGSVQSLTRRLVAMASIGRVSRGVIVASGFLLAATVLVGIVPWRLVAAEPKSANDAKNLQGTWQAVDLEANGEKRPDDQAKELQIVFKGDEVFAVKPEGEGRKVKFKLDPSKTPKTIDLIAIDGSDKGKIAAGIYSLKHGKLRVCVNLFGKDTTQRPTEFKTQSGDGVGFVTLERAKGK